MKTDITQKDITELRDLYDAGEKIERELKFMKSKYPLPEFETFELFLDKVLYNIGEQIDKQ